MAWKALAVGVATVLVLGCSKAAKGPVMETATSGAAPSEQTAASEVSFYALVAPVLATKCVRCHSGETPAGDVSLGSYEDVLQVVVAGNAEESELYEEISGPTPKMPKGAPPLPEKTVQIIRDWINQGAKNN